MDWDRPLPVTSETRAGIERALKAMPVGAVMTTPVRCVEPSASLSEVRADLLQNGLGALAVVGPEGNAIGVITKTDLLRAERGEAEARVEVGEAMSPFVISVLRSEPIEHAISRMSHDHVHHVVVLDEERRPVGIVSTLDILHWLTTRLGLTFAQL